MSVAAFVGDPREAESVVTWAGRFAAARRTELIVFYVREVLGETDLLLSDSEDELAADPTRAAILKALQRIVRTRKARTGRIARHAVQIRRIATLEPTSATIARLRLESPELFIAAGFGSPEQSDRKTMGRQIAAKISCDTIVLFRAGPCSAVGSHIVIGMTDGSDLTPEVFARTEPNILDLLIALFSGMAAAYAIARPSLAGSIAGVAIATALVPPLCSMGICLSYQQYPEAVGAFALLLANVLAIIIAAAASFRMMGLRAFTEGAPSRFASRRVASVQLGRRS